MANAADQNLFTHLQEDITELIDLLKKSEAVQLPGQGSHVQQGISETQVTDSMDALQIGPEEHNENFGAVFQRQEMWEQEIRVATLNLEKENRQVLQKLVSIGELISVKLQGMEKDLTETSEKIKELEQEGFQMKKDIACLYNRQGKKHQFFALDLVFVCGRSNSSFPGAQRSYFFHKKCCLFAKTLKPVVKELFGQHFSLEFMLRFQTKVRKQGWRCGESARLRLISRPCSERLFSGYSGFSPCSETDFFKFK